MLKRKQYLITLVIAVIIFIIFFIITYYRIQERTLKPQHAYESPIGRSEQSIDVLGDIQTQPVTIQPYTKIHLLLVDEHDQKIEDKIIETPLLLGLSEQQIKQQFEGYEVVNFDEKEVIIKKVLITATESSRYYLGIQNEWVCIIQQGEGNVKQYIPLNIDFVNFSKYTYSLLLKEQIEISAEQKDRLIDNPHYIEKILQSYQEE